MALLFGVLLLVVFPCVSKAELDIHEDHVELMLDPFDKLKDLLDVHTTGLTLANVNKLIQRLSARIHCTTQTTPQVSAPPSCGRSLCISGNDVFSYLGLGDTDELLESSFGDLSNLLVYYTTIAKNNCGQPVSINAGSSKKFYSDELTRYFTRGQLLLNSLTAKTLQEAIDDLNDVYESDDEKDDSHDDDHSGEHTDGDNDHSHEHSDEMTTKDGHTDDHGHDDHDNDHVTAPTMVHDDQSTESVHDSHEHDDDHDSHEADSHEHDDDVPKVNLHKTKCLSAGRLYDEMYKDPLEDAFGDEHDLEALSQLLLYHMLSGDKVLSNCRLLPRKNYIENGLLEYVHAFNNTIQKTELQGLLTTLGLVQSSTATAVTGEIHDGHDHHRRKRALPDTPTFDKKCYNADEIIAIYNSRNTDTLSKQNFLELCPSLIYQQVTKACQPLPKEGENHHLGTAEAYGYGTVAVFIVCLCAIGAILFIPLANTICLNTFDYVLAVFLGLAVGTLVSDAILHLFPAAFGLHVHDDEHGHAHGDEIVMEPYVGYGLAAMAGIYAFYFMEMMFNLLSKGDNYEDSHGHSHMPTLDKFELHSGQKNGKSESRSELYEVRSEADSEYKTNVTSPGAKSLILMVLLGDALHNFADGLAIGAAFTESPSVGIATTITVFCHELPHELGDYAILVSSGMSRARALIFNFLSSLTAFIGLYIGVSVSTDNTVRQWIFAVTAGLFLYIALADMLPHMTNGGKGSRGKRLRMIICNNVGIFLGAVILVLLSLFESKIKV